MEDEERRKLVNLIRDLIDPAYYGVNHLKEHNPILFPVAYDGYLRARIFLKEEGKHFLKGGKG